MAASGGMVARRLKRFSISTEGDHGYHHQYPGYRHPSNSRSNIPITTTHHRLSSIPPKTTTHYHSATSAGRPGSPPTVMPSTKPKPTTEMNSKSQSRTRTSKPSVPGSKKTHRRHHSDAPVIPSQPVALKSAKGSHAQQASAHQHRRRPSAPFSSQTHRNPEPSSTTTHPARSTVTPAPTRSTSRAPKRPLLPQSTVIIHHQYGLPTPPPTVGSEKDGGRNDRSGSVDPPPTALKDPKNPRHSLLFPNKRSFSYSHHPHPATLASPSTTAAATPTRRATMESYDQSTISPMTSRNRPPSKHSLPVYPPDSIGSSTSSHRPISYVARTNSQRQTGSAHSPPFHRRPPASSQGLRTKPSTLSHSPTHSPRPSITTRPSAANSRASSTSSAHPQSPASILPPATHSSSSIPASATANRLHRSSRSDPPPSSHPPELSHGPMPLLHSRLASSSPSISQHDHPDHLAFQDDTTGELSSSSVLSTITVKPHRRTTSETSSTDLRVTKLKFKDRSKDPPSSSADEPPNSLPKSKKLINMKERNERIFASINASLNPSTRPSPVEPPLSASSSSPASSHSPLPSSQQGSDNRLRVPGSLSARSGLIPFAKGCSPSPRKIVGPQSHSSNGTLEHAPSGPSRMDPEILEDEQSGSVRLKRPERSRLIRRTLPAESSSVQPDDQKSSHSQAASSSDTEDSSYQSVDLPSRRKHLDIVDRILPHDSSNSPATRHSHECSETVSLHTSSSGTIGANDGDTTVRPVPGNSTGMSTSNSRARDRQHSWDDELEGFDSREEDETMITPVKSRRHDSFQKTLRHVASVSESLVAYKIHEPAPMARTPRPSTGHRRRSSSFDYDQMEPSGRLHQSTSPYRMPSSASMILPNSQALTRSPPSQLGLSRRSRPGLPDQFTKPRQSDHPDLDGHHLTHFRRSVEAHSSRSPHTNRSRLSHSIHLRYSSNADSPSHRHSDIFSGPPDRTEMTEPLSRYDVYHSYSGRSKHPSVRNKHASWSVSDDVGGEITRSQSVLGGVFDPRTSELRGMASRTRTSYTSPVSQRYVSYSHNGADDEDDGQTSMTTYTQSMPRKAGSAGSRSRTSEWGFEEPDANHQHARVGSRASVYNSLVLTPSRRKSIIERDRTLRGNGGAIAVAPKALNQLVRSSYQDNLSPSHNTDNHSSSSGNSSQRLKQSQRATNPRQPLPPAKLNESLNRYSRPSTRATSSAAGGLTTALSPTPNVDHHNLLISAYEALGDHQNELAHEETNEIFVTLNNLISSVVRKSCEIDATLAQLNESSLNHQVEMELVDDSVDRKIDDREAFPSHSTHSPTSQATRQKYRMMKDNVDHMTKVQGRLVRASNDQIRDLTEALICLAKLQRSRKEYSGARQVGAVQSRVRNYDDPRDSHGSGGNKNKEELRSGSRASGRFSRSHSPSKLRHPIELSPLSDISSHDESPLSRVQQNLNDPLRYSVASLSGPSARPGTSSNSNHHRASTISFTHERNMSLNGAPHHQSRAKKHMSAMSSTSICKLGEDFYDDASKAAHQSLRSDRHESFSRDLTVDEFGLYRKANGRTPRSPEASQTQQRKDPHWPRVESHSTHTIRGSQSSIMFPKTPPRIATASISQATAHSNVSPTHPDRSLTESRHRSRGTDANPDHILRPQSSMSQILHRANSVLSRVEQYPTPQTVPVGYKTNGNVRELTSREMSKDQPIRTTLKKINHTSHPNQHTNGTMSEAEDMSDFDRTAGRQEPRTKGRDWASSTATAALERFSQHIGTNRNGSHGDGVHQNQRRATSSHLTSSRSTRDSSTESERLETDYYNDGRKSSSRHDVGQVGILNHTSNSRRRRKGSIQKLFGLKKSSQVKR